MNLFLAQWRSEMWKLLARKRTYLGFGAFLLLEILIYILLSQDFGHRWLRNLIQRSGESFESYFSGITIGYIILRLSTFLLGGIYLTLVAGDVVAKESEDGNLRLILARPITRVRLLAVKYISCIVYGFVLMQFISWTALTLGVILRGWGGGLFAFAPEQEFMAFYDAGEGLQRYALGTIGISLSMMGASSVAFFFSCWRIKPAAATITALSYLFMDMVLREGHFMDSYKHLLMTNYIASWSLVFFEQIPWPLIIRNYTILSAICLTLFVLGATVFENRDLKS
jgi:ABC-2 type transport system permease protein